MALEHADDRLSGRDLVIAAASGELDAERAVLVGTFSGPAAKYSQCRLPGDHARAASVAAAIKGAGPQ